MTNFSKPQGNTPKNGGGSGGQPAQGGYKSRLDEILAKAGANNPIAAAQAKNIQPAPTAAQPQAPAAPQPPQAPPPVLPNTAVPGSAPQPAAPQAGPVDPNARLQQILAMAGKTPAQRAQAQAQQAAANAAAGIQAVIQAYMQAVAQDPRKALMCDIEFQANPQANDDVYFKCYGDAAGNIYWDVFGNDISYIMPSRIASFHLYDDYYKGVPHADFMADMATATIHSNRIV